MCTNIKNAILTLTLIIGISLSSCNQASKKDDASQEQTSPEIEATDTESEIKEDDFSKIALYHHAKATAYGSGESLNWLKENNLALYHHAKATFYDDSSKSIGWLKK